MFFVLTDVIPCFILNMKPLAEIGSLKQTLWIRFPNFCRQKQNHFLKVYVSRKLSRQIKAKKL